VNIFTKKECFATWTPNLWALDLWKGSTAIAPFWPSVLCSSRSWSVF